MWQLLLVFCGDTPQPEFFCGDTPQPAFFCGDTPQPEVCLADLSGACVPAWL
jgi:hypothetical protein